VTNQKYSSGSNPPHVDDGFAINTDGMALVTLLERQREGKRAMAEGAVAQKLIIKQKALVSVSQCPGEVSAIALQGERKCSALEDIESEFMNFATSRQKRGKKATSMFGYR
jgi:hypothetical protein